MATIKIDTEAIDELVRDIEKAKRILLSRLAERGYQLLRKEVPYQTGNLRQGVAPPDVKYPRATLTVSARSARTGGGKATVHLKSGTTKTVNLKPTRAYNYADVVAKGNKDTTLYPKKAKAFLIPIPTAPTDKSYLVADGQIYVVRRTRKAQKPNPYDERAAEQLETEAPAIGAAVLQEIFE